jgi:tripartite-type tricarboxylate transporter receptor subunit TctC
MSVRSRIAAAVAALTLLACLPARAQNAALDFFKGKTVRIVLGVGVGGGFDAYAHLIAPHLGKALGASVVVETLPGAGQLIAINRVYAAPPDGLTIMLLNGTPAALAQIIEQDNARFDLTRMENLGIVNASPSVWLAGPKSGLKTANDAVGRSRPVLFGGTGPTGGLADPAAMTCEALRLQCKIVIGYKSSSDVVLAAERGEIESLYVSDSSAFHYDRSGRVKAIATMARVRSKLLPDVPTLFESVQIPPEDAWIVDFRSDLDDLGRIFVATPGVPLDRLDVLRKALQDILTDPDVVAEGAAAERFIDFRDWKAADDMMRRALKDVPADRKARVRKAIMEKYK